MKCCEKRKPTFVIQALTCSQNIDENCNVQSLVFCKEDRLISSGFIVMNLTQSFENVSLSLQFC